MKKLKRLFNYGEPMDCATLFWQVFMSFTGSADCAKLSLEERSLVIEMYKHFDSWLSRQCTKADNREEKRLEEIKKS